MKRLLLIAACLTALPAGPARARPADSPRGGAPSSTEVRRSTWPVEVAPSQTPPARDLSHWREACRDDIKSLCRMSYSQEEVEACLSRNADKLSAGCRAAQRESVPAQRTP
jgi:hypothetical protein